MKARAPRWLAVKTAGAQFTGAPCRARPPSTCADTIVGPSAPSWDPLARVPRPQASGGWCTRMALDAALERRQLSQLLPGC